MRSGTDRIATAGLCRALQCVKSIVLRLIQRADHSSIELQGGISGAPVLNELGEVVGLVTFTQTRALANKVGQVHFERSFYAIPVEVLRRLRADIHTKT